MPACGCDAGFYDDMTNPACVTCPYPCTECSDATTCTVCQGAIANRESDPNCHCSSGFYNDGLNNC